MEKLKGTGVALVTPFDQQGNIDYSGLTNLLDYTAKGVDYYVVQGTTGESATTSADEKKDILRHVKANNKSALPIVYGLGGNNTLAVIDTINSTDFEGVDAILSVSPYYNKPSQNGIIAHFSKIADESPVPVILYNVPGRTSSNLSAGTTIELSKHPNIIGVKEASGNVEQAMTIHQGTSDDFLLISGDDLLTPALIAVGAVGVISVLANGFPEIFRKMIDTAFKKDHTTSAKIISELAELNPLMYEESNPVGIKEVLKLQGICNHYVRMPLLPATKDLSDRIKALL